MGWSAAVWFFFFNDPPPPEIYPLPLHDALPIWYNPSLFHACHQHGLLNIFHEPTRRSSHIEFALCIYGLFSLPIVRRRRPTDGWVAVQIRTFAAADLPALTVE